MPIIVDEIVISVEVTNQAGSMPPTTDDRQILVEECVERVLEILREKEER